MLIGSATKMSSSVMITGGFFTLLYWTGSNLQAGLRTWLWFSIRLGLTVFSRRFTARFTLFNFRGALRVSVAGCTQLIRLGLIGVTYWVNRVGTTNSRFSTLAFGRNEIVRLFLFLTYELQSKGKFGIGHSSSFVPVRSLFVYWSLILLAV